MKALNFYQTCIFVCHRWRSSSLLLVAFVTGCGDVAVVTSVADGISESEQITQLSPVEAQPLVSASGSVAPDSVAVQATQTQPQTTQGTEPASEPASGSTPLPVPLLESAQGPVSVQEPESVPEPVAAPALESVSVPVATPERESVPEPVAAPEPESAVVQVAAPEPESAVVPVATPEPESALVPVALPESESAPMPVALPTPEATPEPGPAPPPPRPAAETVAGSQPQNDGGTLPVSSEAPNLRKIPDQLDNLYRYNVNSTSDLVTFKGPDGSLQQVFSYWSDDRRLHVTQRRFPDGEFSTPIDVHTAVHGNNDALEYDSHNSSAIGIAQNGVMFVTGNHHSSVLNMAKTTTAFDIGSFANMLPEQMVASSEVNRVTYPSFFTHDRFLYFSYREQEVGQGAPRFRWLINRYDPDRDEWQKAVQFNTGIDLRLYVSHVAVPADGSSMHVFATWRDDSAGGGVENQRDYFHLYSTDGTNWNIKNSDKTITASDHLWYDNGDRTLPGYTGIELTRSEKIWEAPAQAGPRSAGDVAVDSNGNPHSLVKSLSGPLYHHYWDGMWKSTQLSVGSVQSIDIVPCPSTMGALIHSRGRVSFRSLDPAHPTYNSPVLLAQGFTSSDFSLSIDKQAIRLGYVSFLLTSNSHFLPDQHRGATPNPQPAWIATEVQRYRGTEVQRYRGTGLLRNQDARILCFKDARSGSFYTERMRSFSGSQSG